MINYYNSQSFFDREDYKQQRLNDCKVRTRSKTFPVQTYLECVVSVILKAKRRQRNCTHAITVYASHQTDQSTKTQPWNSNIQ